MHRNHLITTEELNRNCTPNDLDCLAGARNARQAEQARQRAKDWLNKKVVGRPVPSVRSSRPSPPAVLRRGDALGELEIPRLRVSVMVFEGDDAGILKVGAGHIPGTSVSPGEGNIGIAAHGDTYFRRLRAIRPKDVIAWRTPEGDARFTVTRTEIVQPSDIGVLARAPGRDLTLVTCYPFSYIGHAPKRFIVYARKLAD